MDTRTQNHRNLEEIRLDELFRLVWRQKWLMFWCILVCGVAAGIASQLVTKKYEALIIISPVSNTPGSGSQIGGLGGIASQFGGLASLAGLSLAGDSRKAESLAVLQSQALTERYVQKNNLLPVLYASLWDAGSRTWTTTNPKQTPTLWKANEYFKKSIRVVETDNKTGLVTMFITWKDPNLAADWANGLVKMTNDYLREKAINEGERNISYLTEQATKTDVVGVKQAVYTILQSEINKVMLARGSDEYALKVIDPATPAERPTSPKPVIWVIVGLLSGAMLGTIVAIARAHAPVRPLSPAEAAP